MMKPRPCISVSGRLTLALAVAMGVVSVAQAQTMAPSSGSTTIAGASMHDRGAELRRIIALQRAQLGELKIIAHDLAVHPIGAMDAAIPGHDGLSLAGCAYDKRMYPKGTTIMPAPGMAQTCTDAIRGQPTYGLAWHMVNAASTTIPAPKG